MMWPTIPGFKAVKFVDRKCMTTHVFADKVPEDPEITKTSPGKLPESSNTYHGRKIAESSGPFHEGEQQHGQ